LGLAGVIAAAQQPAAPAPAPQQPSEIAVVISGDPGTPPRYAVPDCVALTPDAAEAARTITQVLFDDLAFEREFYLIPRDTYRTVAAARTPEQVPFDGWRELGADAVFFCSVQKSGANVTIQVRLFNVRTRQAVFSKEYSGTDRNPRLYAHTVADEVHDQQTSITRGVARTKIAFISDRNQQSVAGTVENRVVKEVYIADYDGANVQRITTSRQLNTNPAWTPDARGLGYTSFAGPASLPDIFISYIYRGVRENPTRGRGTNYLPAFSPDGTRIAFMSGRDNNPEIYVANIDGTNLRRLTNHAAGDVSPTWSPTGTQVAFISDRGGRPQLYVVGADGVGLRRLETGDGYVDRPTWSPAPFNEIAYTAQTSGSGYDIKVFDLATGMTRQLTFGEGTNESPSYSANGRHLAFMSTRAGRYQIFTIHRDGRGVKQITREGTNTTPAWSN
jgi:TolB protein